MSLAGFILEGFYTLPPEMMPRPPIAASRIQTESQSAPTINITSLLSQIVYDINQLYNTALNLVLTASDPTDAKLAVRGFIEHADNVLEQYSRYLNPFLMERLKLWINNLADTLDLLAEGKKEEYMKHLALLRLEYETFMKNFYTYPIETEQKQTEKKQTPTREARTEQKEQREETASSREKRREKQRRTEQPRHETRTSTSTETRTSHRTVQTSRPAPAPAPAPAVRSGSFRLVVSGYPYYEALLAHRITGLVPYEMDVEYTYYPDKNVTAYSYKIWYYSPYLHRECTILTGSGSFNGTPQELKAKLREYLENYISHKISQQALFETYGVSENFLIASSNNNYIYVDMKKNQIIIHRNGSSEKYKLFTVSGNTVKGWIIVPLSSTELAEVYVTVNVNTGKVEVSPSGLYIVNISNNEVRPMTRTEWEEYKGRILDYARKWAAMYLYLHNKLSLSPWVVETLPTEVLNSTY